MDTRIATEADLDGLTATLTAAFESDPLWVLGPFKPPRIWRFGGASISPAPCVTAVCGCGATTPPHRSGFPRAAGEQAMSQENVEIVRAGEDGTTGGTNPKPAEDGKARPRPIRPQPGRCKWQRRCG